MLNLFWRGVLHFKIFFPRLTYTTVHMYEKLQKEHKKLDFKFTILGMIHMKSIKIYKKIFCQLKIVVNHKNHSNEYVFWISRTLFSLKVFSWSTKIFIFLLSLSQVLHVQASENNSKMFFKITRKLTCTININCYAKRFTIVSEKATWYIKILLIYIKLLTY